jgi:hypothetical protein
VLIYDCFPVNFRNAEGVKLLGNQDCQRDGQLEQATMKPSMARTREQMQSPFDGETQRPKKASGFWMIAFF